MKKEKYLDFKLYGFLLILLYQSNIWAQLNTVSNQQIDFSNAITTIASGNWTNASIWSNNQVPTETADVIIKNGHTIYIDKQGASSNQIVELCSNIKIEQSAILQMGHNTNNFSKDLQINGSILCNGTFSSGRNQPQNSGDGLIYDFNSRIYLKLNSETTFISGSGFFNPRTLNVFSNSGNKNLVVDIYNLITDENFVIKSDDRVNATIEYFSYVKINGVLGLTGSTHQWSSPTAKADMLIKGIVVTNDVSLFTKNETSGDASSLTIDTKGSLYTKKINNSTTDKKAAAAGFSLTINSGGLFKLGDGINFNSLLSNNANFTYTNNGELRLHYSETLPSTETITSSIDQFDPNKGNNVPQAMDVFGASHIAGWYNFTDRPYLLEGLDKYKEFGATSVKTTLSNINGRMFNAYPFNHSWPNFQSLKEVAQHQFIDSLFKRNHIKTHTFWTTTKNQSLYKEGADFNHQNFLKQEEEFYELTKYLLQTYGDKDKTFVYQNWEGDWMLRGEGINWEDNPSTIPDDVTWKIEGMARMFRARQRGTERARNEFSNSKAKVFHAIEFNKLWMLKNGNRITMMDNNTPSVLGNVIPATRIDLASWSAYDGGWTNNSNPHAHAMWKGLEIAHYFTTQTGEHPSRLSAQIGEFAINENPPYNGNNTEQVIRNRYGRYVGMALALDIPNFYLWNFFCSGQQGAPNGFTWEKDVQYETDFLYEWMDGKWIVEPDGSWGFAATFLMEQWANSLSSEHNSIIKNQINLYPNPSKGFITIDSTKEINEVLIFDVKGKKIQRIKTKETNKIKLNNIKSGFYFLKIKLKNKSSITKKLIVN